jgi:hypothetical protein
MRAAVAHADAAEVEGALRAGTHVVRQPLMTVEAGDLGEPVATAYSIRSDGDAFAHLHADTPAAARVYARLGFAGAGAGALDIFSAP